MFSHCSILHIEDDTRDAEVFRDALNHLGFSETYERVPDADAAITIPERSHPRPDLVVAANPLPHGGSADFLEWARSPGLLGGVPIVAWTGVLNPEEQRAAFEHGATAYFAKSGSLGAIANAVRRLVDQPRG